MSADELDRLRREWNDAVAASGSLLDVGVTDAASAYYTARYAAEVAVRAEHDRRWTTGEGA